MVEYKKTLLLIVSHWPDKTKTQMFLEHLAIKIDTTVNQGRKTIMREYNISSFNANKVCQCHKI